jgi:NAD(P)-dependent dehydrogenase (short-subunit alcohol dehydrogenase family)
MTRLAGKICIVTGAGSGIGEAIARRFAAEGACVVIAEQDSESGLRVANAIAQEHPGCGIFILTDVADPDSVDRMVSRVVREHGLPDVLVNNAGINVFHDPLGLTVQDWKRCMAVDLDGAWHCCRAVLPHMLGKGQVSGKGYGAIINIASNHAERVIKGTFPYPVAKHALIGLTRSLALEYAAQGIAINAISPGWIMTPLSERYFADKPDPAEAQRVAEARQPPGRLGRPEEVAAVAALLASDEARFMIGANLVIDGGVTIRMYDDGV